MTPEDARAYLNYLLTLNLRQEEAFGPLALAFVKEQEFEVRKVEAEHAENHADRRGLDDHLHLADPVGREVAALRFAMGADRGHKQLAHQDQDYHPRLNAGDVSIGRAVPEDRAAEVGEGPADHHLVDDRVDDAPE